MTTNTVKYAIALFNHKYQIPKVISYSGSYEHAIKKLFVYYQKEIQKYTQIKDHENIFYDEKIKIINTNIENISLKEFYEHSLFIQKNMDEFSECKKFELYKVEKIDIKQQELK
jgi:hypothetical protein